MKKVLLVLAVIGLALPFVTGNLKAEAFDQTPDTFYSKALPDQMAPGSRIRFVSSTEFVVECGGIVENTFEEWANSLAQFPGVLCE